MADQIRERVLKVIGIASTGTLAKAASGLQSATGLSKVRKAKANDGEYDHYNDRIDPRGWMLDAFNALQGPILYNHDAGDGGWLGLGKKDVLPIGKGHAYVEGKALYLDFQLDLDDPFAAEIDRKIEKGVLGAVSVRFIVHEAKENERGGLDSSKHELLEVSVVTIPGNPRALIERKEKQKALIDQIVASPKLREAVLAKIASIPELQNRLAARLGGAGLEWLKAENRGYAERLANLRQENEASLKVLYLGELAKSPERQRDLAERIAAETFKRLVAAS